MYRAMEIGKEIQQDKFKSNKHKVVLNILFTAGWLGCQQQRLLKDFDISPQQYNVLRILRGQRGKPISVNGIQERMLDKSSNASRLIDKLKEKKLADRLMCQHDRRQVDIVLTDKGFGLLLEIDKHLDESEEGYTGITEKEAEQLSYLLDKLRE
jgi:DNA-binding MarR family transcriptional regulator